MPAHWKEWEKAKKDIKEDAAAKGSAVDQALGILRGAQEASKKGSNVRRCSVCGGVKFKTLNKGAQYSCRSCGKVMSASGETPST